VPSTPATVVGIRAEKLKMPMFSAAYDRVEKKPTA